MSGKSVEQPGHDADESLQALDLGSLRAAAEQEELAEAQARLADGFGSPLTAGDPHTRLARDSASTGRPTPTARAPHLPATAVITPYAAGVADEPYQVIDVSDWDIVRDETAG